MLSSLTNDISLVNIEFAMKILIDFFLNMQRNNFTNTPTRN